MFQTSVFSLERIRLFKSWIKERLWVRPLAVSVLSVFGIFVANLADDSILAGVLPQIGIDSVISLLTIMASSMLVIATFAVGSMVSAYSSASTGSTPRSFPLVVADDVTQNALSAFVGAFIFSLTSLIAVKNNMFGDAGLFSMFALTVLVFVIVIGTFVRWVDRIARLGRITNTVEKVEDAAADALERRRHAPTLGAVPHKLAPNSGPGMPIASSTVGYIQHIDIGALQSCAEDLNCHLIVAALPGTFVSTSSTLLHVVGSDSLDIETFRSAFSIGRHRAFEDDPRFGLLALSEIADKALSPALNDPGTAISIIGTMVRLFTLWQAPLEDDEIPCIDHDRIFVPALTTADLFDDAFTSIARDGAAIVEVSIRLQKAFSALLDLDDQAMAVAARKHSQLALARSEQAMANQTDLDLVREAAASCMQEKQINGSS